MMQPDAAYAVELLIDEARKTVYADSRFRAGLAQVERAVEAAEKLGNASLLLDALYLRATALALTGDYEAAIAIYSRIVGMAEDTAVIAVLEESSLGAVIMAHALLVSSAFYAEGVTMRDLFDVLDAADHRLVVIGHRDWRSAILLERSRIHAELEEWDAALALAEEALVAYRVDLPRYDPAAYRYHLSRYLREVGRTVEAEEHCLAILNDRDTSPYSRRFAFAELTYCALARNKPKAALKHAKAGVEIAEFLGDRDMLRSLSPLIAAHRALKNYDDAWLAVGRSLELAERLGGHRKLFNALLDAADVALDRRDFASARTFIDQLGPHAAALDIDTATTNRARKVGERRRRLEELERGAH